MKGFILILLFSFIISCSRLEMEPACYHLDEIFGGPDGYAMGWNCLPDSFEDGELNVEWDNMTDSQKDEKHVVFAVYLDGPYQGKAYRLREDDRGAYIIKGEKKMYLLSP